MLVEDIHHTKALQMRLKNLSWWTFITLFSPLFGHFRLCSENERESIDVLLYTSMVKNKGLVGNIYGCAVLFCGAWHTFQKHVPYFF